MTQLRRFASALALTFSLLPAAAQAQRPSVSTVNITPDEQKVSISAVGDVLDMRVAVSDEAGDVVFEGGLVTGDKLDWTMRDPQGRRVPAGTYTLTVTYRASNGKLRRRVEQVLVTEEVTGEAKQEGAAQQSAPPTPSAPVEGAGTAGRVARFISANTIGNSSLYETGGRIGLSTTTPQQKLHVFSTSTRLRLESSGATALTATEYVNNVGRVWQAGAGGSSAAGVFGKFFVYDQVADQYRLVIDTSGNVGIGTTAPASRLTVNGQIQLTGAGNGIKFADGTVQTTATTGTITGTGTVNRLVKFTGPSSFGNSTITESGGNVSFTGLRTETTTGTPNVIGGLSANLVTEGVRGATIGGGGNSGLLNRVTDDFGTVGGGINNRAGDGAGTTDDATTSTVGGGSDNTASGERSTVGGGSFNTANGNHSTVGGGNSSVAFGDFSTVGGGFDNEASGFASTVPGGNLNTAQAFYSFAAGQRAQALHQGAFVWSDSTTGSPSFFSSTAANQFLINATGGVGIGTNAPGAARLKVAGGDVYITQPNSLVITSPNGSCWQIRVGDAGALFAASVPCP